MQKFIHLITQTSVGRKFMMALTGIGALGFLIVHLAGNLTVYGGEESLNAYAEKLHSIPLLPLAELGLAALFLLHIAYGILLTLQNRRARGEARYAVNARSGQGADPANVTMIYTGALIFLFMGLHLWGMKFTNHDLTTWEKVVQAFSNPVIVLCYLVGIAAVGLHLYHGASSTLQSLGARHPRYEALIVWAGRGLALALALGFASIPLLFQLAPAVFGWNGEPIG